MDATRSSDEIEHRHEGALAAFTEERRARLELDRVARRASFEDYLAHPVGRWVSGEGWLHFCLRGPWLAGTVLWGDVDATAFESILRCATAVRSAIPEPHAALVDGRRTRWLSPESYAMIAEYMVEHRRALGERVTRLAIVRPEGILGAAAEGFFQIVPAPYPAKLWTDPALAIGWLECHAHRETIEELARLAAMTTRATLLRELHTTIENDLAGISVDSASKKLGLSSRSLQRKLQLEGTSFHRELSMARLRTAQRSMLESNRSLACIAQEAGFASHAVFSTAFRRLVGVSPKQWRSEARRPTQSNREPTSMTTTSPTDGSPTP